MSAALSRRRVLRPWLLPVIALAAWPGSLLSAQGTWPPQRLENLKVFPDTIGVRPLINVMIGFTRALGVRCTYCHVGEEGQPLATYNLPSDDKVTKRKARVMLRMVQAVNDSFLPEVHAIGHEGGAGHADHLVVQCAMCHRGQPRPLTLEQRLMAVIDSAGAEAAVQEYRDLRARFYGRATLDFGEQSLNTFGYRLLRSGRATVAVAMFRLNLEMFPESANAHDSLGDGLKADGDREGALHEYRQAQALNPNLRGIQARIDSLTADQ